MKREHLHGCEAKEGKKWNAIQISRRKDKTFKNIGHHKNIKYKFIQVYHYD